MPIRTSLFAAAAVVASSLLFGANAAAAASFDCKKASSRIEHLICDDIDANYYDGQLQAAYQGALDRSNHPEQVRQQQRDWLKQRDACGDSACVAAASKKRVALLSSLSDEPEICSDDRTLAINACGDEYNRRADLELARYLAAARKRLIDDAADDKVFTASRDAIPKFDASQKVWQAYRKAECEAVYTDWSDGTIRGAMYNACYLALTKERTRVIWESWLQFMDSTPSLMPEPTTK